MAIAFENFNIDSVTGGAQIVVAFGGGLSGRCKTVAVSIDSATVSVSSVVNSGGGESFTRKDQALQTGTRAEIWTTSETGSVAGGNVEINLSGSTTATAAVGEYSGVVAIGTAASDVGTSANPTITVATQDNDNFIVAAFGILTTSAPTALTGNLRAATNASNSTVALNDNTSASPGSVTNAVTKAATDWAVAAVELRTSAVVATVTPVPHREPHERPFNMASLRR